MIITNACNIQGRVNRLDAKYGKTQSGNEYVNTTFTLQVDETQLRVNVMQYKYKKDGTVMGAYEGIETLVNECKALHKTVRLIGEDKATEIQDSTIVENIDECDAIRFSNYGNFKYCRIEENSYMREGELVKNLRLVGASPNRVDETKKEYVPTADFEIAGKIVSVPVLIEKDEVEFMQFKVVIPVYTEAWGEREAKVDLVEMTVRLNDESAFGYVEDEFELGSFVSLNGTIVREVKRTELEVPTEDDGRGFGRKVQHEAKYKTEIIEYYNLLGGFPLEVEEIEETPAFSQELWEKAKAEQEQKEQEMKQEKPSEPSRTFGRSTTQSTPKKNNVLPF